MFSVAPVRVSETLLIRIFDALDVWRKIENGRLVEIPGLDPIEPATTDWCVGGTSYYTRIENAAGR